MTDPDNPAVHAGRLLAGVSAHVDQHLQEIEKDLQQTSALLAEAIGKLTSGFLAVHSSIAEQQKRSGCAASADGAVGVTNGMRDLNKEIGHQIDAIVTGLQFQDLTEQLLGRMACRVQGVRAVMGKLESRGNELADRGPVGDEAAAIDRLERLFTEQNVALEAALRKAVTQTHMDSGDVELF